MVRRFPDGGRSRHLLFRLLLGAHDHSLRYGRDASRMDGGYRRSYPGRKGCAFTPMDPACHRNGFCDCGSNRDVVSKCTLATVFLRRSVGVGFSRRGGRKVAVAARAG